MNSILGFLLINVYAFLLIVATSVVFFNKQRLRQFEDETYKNFLLANICISLSGLVLGLAVNPMFNINTFIIIILNKIYLICLLVWIAILTFYYLYVSLKDRINKDKWFNIFKIGAVISIFIIAFLPLNVDISESGALATGASIIFTYTMFALGFILQIVCLLLNYKNLKNKKYMPLYLLIFLGTLIVVLMIINPSLNYLINPAFIFIAFIMYHTIENPDMQMIETLLRNKELVEETVNDKSNFLFKVSQEMRKPVKNIVDNVKLYKSSNSLDEKNELLNLIEQDANNAYFIINDITNVSSMDVKKIKVQDNVYMTKKLFVDIEHSVKNSLSICKKDELINFNIKTYNSYPEKLCGDYIKLKQVLLSVLSNSIKHTKKGFIDVEIDTIARYDVCRMVFTIKDSGSGMSISQINEVLSSSDSIDISDFEEIDSLELELPVVIKILKMLGGSISIRSEEEQGTIVVIVLDQKIANNKIDSNIKDAKRYSTNVKSRKRVLVVDDSENLEVLERMLSKYDIDVVSTLMGQDVVDKIDSGDNFDLILIKDEIKPDSAYTILNKLKADKKFNIPVVIMINKDKEFIKKHFIEDGFSDCIVYESIDKDLKMVCDKYI